MIRSMDVTIKRQLKNMFRSMVLIPLVLILSVNCMAQPEALPDVLAKVKSSIQQKDSCWKLTRVQDRKIDNVKTSEQEWLCHQDAVTIYYFEEPSMEVAARAFEEMRTAPVQAPGDLVAAPKIGDESSITTYPRYSSSSYVFFRRGNIVVRIDSNMLKEPKNTTTLKNAVEFGQAVDEQIAAVQNRLR